MSTARHGRTQGSTGWTQTCRAVRFAGTNYRVGNAHRLAKVEVPVAGDMVQIAQDGGLIKTHAARHHGSREHGAFSTPGGRPQ